ncbi:MAG: 16S rRNA (adenine(1518)-N(6)/adenine(1519)-N(6))-dimethyltransferase RsmA [Tissierellia bacterium]|jgi:16S rRNA (adenine1518-N6/adenine1519-N6)-dimethyltransferase|nr:16S rRNA (adenine(1518)-N(6)/adenine(1519)-N(6))-dimethyltransferase RsmA [Tissierellia bacterium]
MNLTSPKVLKDLLERHNFSFTKSLGQNFLIDQNIIDKIIREGNIQDENILEIGSGIGTLTVSMAKLAKKVVVVEIDEKLKPILSETLIGMDNVEVIFSDILKTSLDKISQVSFNGESYKVVANLPYYITTPILEYLLKSKSNISEIIVMMQKEVATRIVADVGTKEYGSISVFLKYFGESEILMNVPKTVFMPKPKVDSAVIRLKIRDNIDIEEVESLEKVLRAGFGKRRKTILNSLSSGLNREKIEVLEILEKLGINENSRAENLSLEEFLALTEML